MDAVMFLKEKLRMCKTMRKVNFNAGKVESCENCPIEPYCGNEIFNPEIVVSTVEKWSADHPRMTNGQMFKKVFGLVRAGDVGPATDWWSEPYKEPEEEE